MGLGLGVVEELTKAGPKQYFMYHCGVGVRVGKGTVGQYECLGWWVLRLLLLDLRNSCVKVC